jgi:serralysin
MQGGLGNDSYVVDSVGDVVSEALGAGVDRVSSSISFSLSATAGRLNIENLSLTGGALVGVGNALNNTIVGNALNNTLSGLDGNDSLFGLAGNDTLFGGNGNDLLNGGAGFDRLTGNAGFDTFRFDTPLAGNIDLITDFVSFFDTIQLDDDVFSFGDAPGALNPIRFKANAAGVATDLTDRIIYETDTGRLIFDSNGSLAGGAVQFATLLGAPAISAADFVVIA